MDTIIEIAGLQQKNELLQAQVNELTGVVSKMEALIKYYEQQLLLSKRRQFGSSSERILFDVNGEYRQIVLFDETDDDKSIAEPELQDVSYKREYRKGKREDDLSGIPVERIDYELTEEERTCPEYDERYRCRHLARVETHPG